MPIWTYFYLACLVASSFYLVFSVKPFSLVRLSCEVLSVSSYVTIFLISFGLVDVMRPILFSTLLLIYTLLWGVFGYKEHYSFYRMPAVEFAKTVELGNDESIEDAVLSIKIIKSVSVVLIVLLVSPFFYTYFRMF